jgi:tRNA pseudouridine38-40 synthase
MVRAVVGTLLEVGRGKMDMQQFQTIVEGGKRTQAGESGPAQGLHLTQILYPPTKIQEFSE